MDFPISRLHCGSIAQPAKQFEVNAQVESYNYREGKDRGKAKLRVCLRVNKSSSSKKVSQQN